tara:strand:- start:198 stop:953 length:756 start_codon:yes stop_codon:yes gene_type:complete
MYNFGCFNLQALKLLGKHKLLNQLVQKEIVENILNKTELTKEEESNFLEIFFKNNKIKDDSDFDNWLKNKNLNRENFIHDLFRILKHRKHSRTTFSNQSKTRFLKKKQDLDTVVYSILRANNFYIAREIYLKVQSGEQDFGDLIAQYSIGPEKSNRGLVGPVELSKAHPDLIELLRSNPPGQLSKPTNISHDLCVVVRVENFIEAKFDATMQQKINEELFDEWVEKQSIITIEKLFSAKSHDDWKNIEFLS